MAECLVPYYVYYIGNMNWNVSVLKSGQMCRVSSRIAPSDRNIMQATYLILNFLEPTFKK